MTGAFVSVVALPLDVTSPVRLAFVVTFPAVKLAAVPVTLVITPEAGVPSAIPVRKLVNDEAGTPDAKVDPLNVPAGATTAAVVIPVVSPLALIVTTGIAVEEPVVPAVATVARVVATAPADVVMSPVSAGICPAATLPLKSLNASCAST